MGLDLLHENKFEQAGPEALLSSVNLIRILVEIFVSVYILSGRCRAIKIISLGSEPIFPARLNVCRLDRLRAFLERHLGLKTLLEGGLLPLRRAQQCFAPLGIF